MPIETCYLLSCNKCGEPYNAYDVCNNDSESDLAKEARSNGWSYDEEMDEGRCPYCIKKEIKL